MPRNFCLEFIIFSNLNTSPVVLIACIHDRILIKFNAFLKKIRWTDWNLWPEFFTTKSKVQHYKHLKTNHPQACTGNQDRQGRSNFSANITIRTCTIKSDSHEIPEIGMYSSFKAAVINIHIVTTDQITEFNIKHITCTDNTTDIITWPCSAIWFGFMARILTVLIQSYHCNASFPAAWSSCFTHKKALVSAYTTTILTTLPASLLDIKERVKAKLSPKSNPGFFFVWMYMSQTFI